MPDALEPNEWVKDYKSNQPVLELEGFWDYALTGTVTFSQSFEGSKLVAEGHLITIVPGEGQPFTILGIMVPKLEGQLHDYIQGLVKQEAVVKITYERTL